MYSYIRGKLEFKGNDYIVVEAAGIGYKIQTALSTIENIGSAGVGIEIKVFTHLYVREDIMSLYGFATKEELSMFELLISVSGIGPKAAISLLSTVSPSKFGLAIITDDVKTLMKAQGVGNKVAQRIILELKDKMKKAQLSTNIGLPDSITNTSVVSSKISESISALMVLGYSSLEASKAVSAVYYEEMGLETIIKSALKGLAKG